MYNVYRHDIVFNYVVFNCIITLIITSRILHIHVARIKTEHREATVATYTCTCIHVLTCK